MDLSQYTPYIFLAIGLGLIAIACFWDSKKSKLKDIGIQVEGIVFEQSGNNSFDSNINDKIIIRFLTKKQEWITGPIDQNFRILYTGQYKNGDTLKVFYNADKPSEFYVDTKQSELISRIVIGSIGVILTLIGLYQILARQ